MVGSYAGSRLIEWKAAARRRWEGLGGAAGRRQWEGLGAAAADLAEDTGGDWA